MPKHLIVVQSQKGKLNSEILRLIQAASCIKGELHGLVLGNSDTTETAKQLAPHVQQVHTASHKTLQHHLAQPCAKVIADVAKQIQASHVWAAGNVWGSETLPRVAVRLQAGMVSNVHKIIDEQTFCRNVWAGNVQETLQINTTVKVLTVRASAFEPAKPLSKAGTVQECKADPGSCGMHFVQFDPVKSERPELTQARVVVSGGRGVGSKEGFAQLIEPLADVLGAAVGASRVVCDAGWVPSDWQVGQTGKIVAPDLYIAVGISGAIQHLAGIRNAKVVVAINTDEQAPIFDAADYGLVADAKQAVPQLIEALKQG
ncbi:MAG: electron transfer flavoprotein subunit alpha/FixB family protein [Myxococcota bacterium]